MGLTEEFLREVSKENKFQRKYLEEWERTKSEEKELECLLCFFVDELHKSVDDLVDAYLFINNMVMEETYYFIQNGEYRNSTFEDVNKMVYANPQYMEKYMTGLSISDYIWINHLKILRYFQKNSSYFSGKHYLEIGPGFGQYLVKALMSFKFENYYACDISGTSVDRSNKYLKYRKLGDRCNVEERDFFQYRSDVLFDCVVMGEVLEHVEQPLMMLRKIYNIMTGNGKAFITTVINAPAVDHIFLFVNPEEVLDMARDAGFKVKDYLCTTEGDIPLEAALKKKKAMNIAMILEK